MKISRLKLLAKVLLISPAAFLAIALMLFLPAWSVDYWQGWVFLLTLFVPFVFVVSYLLIKDPELLQRRMRFTERLKSERLIISISKWLFFIGILVPGLDHRFGWSHVPSALVIISDIIIFLGYMLVFFVFKENSHTSRIVEVEKGQKVISTGPYSVIRHPMYAGIIPMYIFMPIALGSYWALIFFVPVIGVVIWRIFDEERLLKKELKGYKEYCKKVRYRLVPGVW